MLTQLLEHAGHLVTHDKLTQSVWGETIVTDNSLAQCISEIRGVLGPSLDHVIETVPRRGYIVKEPVVREVSGARLPGPVAVASVPVSDGGYPPISKV